MFLGCFCKQICFQEHSKIPNLVTLAATIAYEAKEVCFESLRNPFLLSPFRYFVWKRFCKTFFGLKSIENDEFCFSFLVSTMVLVGYLSYDHTLMWYKLVTSNSISKFTNVPLPASFFLYARLFFTVNIHRIANDRIRTRCQKLPLCHLCHNDCPIFAPIHRPISNGKQVLEHWLLR